MNRSIDLKMLISCGIKATSGHNTQPWLFSTGKNETHIYPDFARTLPVVDSDNHPLYISSGCTAENIVLAASNYKLRADARISAAEDGTSFIRISLTPDESIEDDELFEYISVRQSTRNEYSQKHVPSGDLQALKQSFNFEGIDVLTFTKPDEIKTLAPLIIESSNRQFQNKKFAKELEVCQNLIKQLNLGSKHPLLLIHFGYSDKMPYSHRRETSDVIIVEREASYG